MNSSASARRAGMSIRRDLMCQVSLKAHQGICQSKLRSQSQSHEPRNVRSSLPLSFRKTSFSKKHGILSAKKGICMGETYLSTAGRGSSGIQGIKGMVGMGFLLYLMEGKALREERPNANGRLGEVLRPFRRSVVFLLWKFH